MNEFYKAAMEVQHDRRPVFEHVIETYLSKIESPSILEIGASRSKDPRDLAGDGFADIYWADFLLKHGKGSLTIVEIDPIALDNCKKILSDFIGRIDIKFICDDGLNRIQSERWSLIYLDGDDDPGSMLQQFECIDRVSSYVFCDDFHGKGTLLRDIYKDFILFKVNWLHEMALYPLLN